MPPLGRGNETAPACRAGAGEVGSSYAVITHISGFRPAARTWNVRAEGSKALTGCLAAPGGGFPLLSRAV